MISTIDEVLQCLRRRRRGCRTQSPAPVASKIPVGTSDARQVRAKYRTKTGGGSLRRIEAFGATVIEPNPSASPVYGRQRRLWHKRVRLLIQGITTFAERDYRRILAGGS